VHIHRINLLGERGSTWIACKVERLAHENGSNESTV
jgi:hypothetical protein